MERNWPGDVAFNPNGNNAAKSTTATFSTAGSYTLTVTAKDAGNLTGAKTVTVNAESPAVTIVSSVSDGGQSQVGCGLGTAVVGLLAAFLAALLSLTRYANQPVGKTQPPSVPRA